jgi:hypothetical protein
MLTVCEHKELRTLYFYTEMLYVIQEDLGISNHPIYWKWTARGSEILSHFDMLNISGLIPLAVAAVFI